MEQFVSTLISPKTIISIIIAIITVIAWLLLRKLSKKRGESKNDASEFEGIILSVARIVILVIAVLWIMQINGINVTSIAAGLGIASAIVGLALQDSLQDVIMGVRILGDCFFKVGECVEYKSRECEIVGFTLTATKLKDLVDGSVITVCNRNITEIRRLGEILDITVPLSYNADTRKIHQVLGKITEKIKALDVVKDSEYLGTVSFEDSAVMYKIRVKCEPTSRGAAKLGSLRLIQDGLEEGGLEIPFNQLDVHCDIRKED